MLNPPLIHLLAPKDQTKWPGIWHKCYDIWKSSPYKIKMWHDEDIDQLLKEDDLDFFNVINTFHKIYKIDYVRYVILEKFGGAYFDMDLEIVKDFIPLLNPQRIYLMEGRLNEYVQNSIMINLKPSYNNSFFVWGGLKNISKKNILNNTNLSKEKNNVSKLVGPLALSNFISSFSKQIDYELLSYHHFASLTSEICFTKHHHTSVWNN